MKRTASKWVDPSFLSTPSARRATVDNVVFLAVVGDISIHALREEGDIRLRIGVHIVKVFLSTPSARRATYGRLEVRYHKKISIHALREEGDAVVELLIET